MSSMIKPISIFFLSSILTFSLFAQDKSYQVGCVGFYNFENLFDTLDTEYVRDTEFTPKGSKLWTTQRYQEKLDHMADVVSQLGTELTPDGVAILGVCEVENRYVLEDFVKHPKVKDRDYQILHFDSRDHRGIDVGLLYQKKYFKPTDAKPIFIGKIPYRQDSSYTRDILLVSGVFAESDTLHVLVNHWPSRSGGEKASRPNRNRAAIACRKVIDSLYQINPRAKVIVMGDLNDDPTNESVIKHLRAKKSQNKLKEGELFNPMYSFYKKGLGTTAWRDAWSLFDQLIVSQGLLDNKDEGFFYLKSKVFNPKYMTQKTGRFKGYPFRSFVGDNWMGGYSDHFPVYLFLAKEI